MDFLRYISTEHSTYTETAPKKTTLQIIKGRITGGWIYFPSGPAGLLHAVVCHGLHQILPSDQGNNYALEDCVVPIYGGLTILQPPLQLKIFTWNTSTMYDHALTLCLFLDPDPEQEKKQGWFKRVLKPNG